MDLWFSQKAERELYPLRSYLIFSHKEWDLLFRADCIQEPWFQCSRDGRLEWTDLRVWSRPWDLAAVVGCPTGTALFSVVQITQNYSNINAWLNVPQLSKIGRLRFFLWLTSWLLDISALLHICIFHCIIMHVINTILELESWDGAIPVPSAYEGMAITNVQWIILIN